MEGPRMPFLVIWLLVAHFVEFEMGEVAFFSYTRGQPGSSPRFVHFTESLGLRNLHFQPLFGSLKVRSSGVYHVSYSLKAGGMGEMQAVLYKGSSVVGPARLATSGCVATPPNTCSGNIILQLHRDDVLRLEIEKGIVAPDNTTGFNTFSGYLVQNNENQITRECRDDNEQQRPPYNNYPQHIYQYPGRPEPPSPPVDLQPPGQYLPPDNVYKPHGGQTRPPVGYQPPVVGQVQPSPIGPPAPPVRFPGPTRPPYYQPGQFEPSVTRPPYYPTYQTERNPISTESGSPVLDSYGAPDYSPPAPLDSYQPPQREETNLIDETTDCCEFVRLSFDQNCCGTKFDNGVFTRSFVDTSRGGVYRGCGYWEDRPMYKHISTDTFLFWTSNNSWQGWIIGSKVGSFDGISISTRKQFSKDEAQCPHNKENVWQYFDSSKEAFIQDSNIRLECLETGRSSRNVHFHTHIHAYERDKVSLPFYSIRADNEVVEANFVYQNPDGSSWTLPSDSGFPGPDSLILARSTLPQTLERQGKVKEESSSTLDKSSS